LTLASLEAPSLETSLLNFPVKNTLQKGATKPVLTGEEPRSCTEGYPVHVQERLGAQVMLKKGFPVPGSCSEKGAQAMFWKGCLMPRSKGCPGHIQERVAQVRF
jgi:hypothetical protein